MENTDADLLALYRGGQVEALGQLVERYRRPLFRFILNMAGGTDDADEIFQEVWLRVIRSLDGYRDRSFIGWLFRIARNCIIDRARAQKRTLSLDFRNEAGACLLETLPGTAASPATRAGNRDVLRRISKAVETLPGEQKEVFLLRMDGVLSFKDIARVQRVSINTALARMRYAVAKLKSALGDEYRALRR